MSTEENKAVVVRDLMEVLEQGHVELLESYYAPDGSDPKMWSLEKYRETVLWFHKICPGYKITILDLMAEGEKVMAHYQVDLSYSVPEDPPPAGFPPLGKPVTWRNFDVYRIVGGKMVSQQSVSGWTDMLVEIGVMTSADKRDVNKAIARRFHEEAWNQGQIDALDAYYAPDGSDPEMNSIETVKENITFFHKIAPGLKFTILDLLAEGDTVMAHWQVDVTYSVPADPPPDEFFLPFGKPVSWKGVDTYRIVDGKIVSAQYANPWSDTLVKIGVIPLEKIKNNKAAVRSFIDALNNRDIEMLEEVCTPEVAKEWTDTLPGMYATMKDHHIELVDMVADGEGVAVKLATSGYHTGELFGLPPTGNWWTNRVYCIIHFSDGKISEVDSLADVENHIKQIGGTIKKSA